MTPSGEAAWLSDVALAEHLSLRLPVRAAHFFRARSVAAAREAFGAARARGLPVLVLGGGSNLVLLRDWPGLCLQPALEALTATAVGDSLVVRAGAGVTWDAVVDAGTEAGAWGLENLAGIPGLAGAAPIQNIGAYGAEIADVLVAVDVLRRDTGEALRLPADACGFAYRTSHFKTIWRDRYLVTGIELALSRSGGPRTTHADLEACRTAKDPAAVAARVRAVRALKLPDPATAPNVGSFFLNPVVPEAQARRLLELHPGAPSYAAGPGRRKLSAGWLIEAAGLKGLEQDGFAVSRRHALVLVNVRATEAAALAGLVRRVRTTVTERFGVTLEPEPTIWPDLESTGSGAATR